MGYHGGSGACDMRKGWLVGLWLWAYCLGAAGYDATENATALAAYTAELNALRAAHGVPPLKLNPIISDAAQYQAEVIAETGQLTHHDKEGRRPSQRLRERGYEIQAVGEILAFAPTWGDALEAWLRSEQHRKILLSPDYRELGVGVREKPNSLSAKICCVVFARREGVYPLIIENDAPIIRSRKVKLFVHGAALASEMRLSADGQNWQPWRKPQPELEWQLPATAGEHTVWVELKIGGKVYRAADTIRYEP